MSRADRRRALRGPLRLAFVAASWVAVVGAAMAVRRADACSPERGGVRWRVVVPATGATGVPRNVRVTIFYGVGSFLLYKEPTFIRASRVGLFLKGGSLVPADVTVRPVDATRPAREQDELVVTIRPRRLLAPNRTYEIRDRFPARVGRCQDEPCVDPGYHTVASFTTGAAVDTTPPAFSGIDRANEGSWCCDTSGCCGPHVIASASLLFTPPRGESAGVHYNLYRFPDLTHPVFRAVHAPLRAGRDGSIGLVRLCEGKILAAGGPAPRGFRTSGGFFVVRAVDAAGNEDRNARVVWVALSCAGLSHPPGLDAGSCVVAPDEGCAVGRGRALPAVFGLLLIALAAAGRGRPSRRRGGGAPGGERASRVV